MKNAFGMSNGAHGSVETAGRYRLYSMSGRPIFAAPRALRRAALQRYQPSTPKRAAYRWVMELSMLTETDGLLSRTVDLNSVFGETIDFDRWLSETGRELGAKNLQTAIFWPPQIERTRIYVHLFDRSEPIGFAKISLATFSNAALYQEAETLRILGQSNPRHFRIPRVLAQGDLPVYSSNANSARHAFVVMEPLPVSAKPIAAQLSSYPRRSIQEYAGQIRRVSPKEIPKLSWWARYRASVDANCVAFDEELASLCTYHIYIRRAHGDLSVNNIAHDGHRLWIFDWEESCPDAPVEADRLGFLMSLNFTAVLQNPHLGLRMLRDQYFIDATPRRRLEIMMALAFRHAANIDDATAVIHNWNHLQ